MRLNKQRNNKTRAPVDRVFLLSILLLSAFGLLMVYESSIVYADQAFGGKYRFLFLQTGWIVIGLIGMYILSIIDLAFIKKHSFKIYVISILLLLFILIPSVFAPEIYGAKRWLIINPSPLPRIPIIGRIGFQPSEFAKLASIIFISAILSSQKYIKLSPYKKFIAISFVIFMSCGLIFIEPDFTTAFVMGVILASITFLSGASVIIYVIGVPIVLMLASIYAFASSYRRERIMTLFSPDSIDKMDAGYHIRQIMIALGSGGIFGLGFGKSRQKYSYLPEVTSDSIFAVIGEEFGYLGSLVVISVFVILMWRGFGIASASRDKFSMLVASGVVIWVVVQALINLGAMVRILPLTGVPLPLVSYGGSSTIFILWGLGLVLNVSRYNNYGKK